jgi:hypothetical protein
LEFSVHDGGIWPLTQAKIDQYESTFPTLDVMASCRVARQWLIDNPTKRKTTRGMPAFLSKWLSGDVDRGRNLKGGGNGTAPRRERPGQPIDHEENAKRKNRVLELDS